MKAAGRQSKRKLVGQTWQRDGLALIAPTRPFNESAGYGSNREGLHQKYRHLSCDPGWISEKYGGGDFSPLRVQDDLGYWRRWQAYWINEIIHEKMFVQTLVRGQHSMSLTQDWIPCDRNKVSSKCPALFKSKLDLKAVLR